MLFQKGTTRFVIAFPSFGFVIKLPIIHLILFYHTVKETWRFGGKMILCMWKINITSPQSLKSHLFGGFYANWMEFQFWSMSKHPLLYPTWFSFFGLFNIQKHGKPLSGKLQLVDQVITKLTHGASRDCGHGFETPINYTEFNGCLRMIDYGSPKLWPVILTYGELIMKVTTIECCLKPDTQKITV